MQYLPSYPIDTVFAMCIHQAIRCTSGICITVDNGLMGIRVTIERVSDDSTAIAAAASLDRILDRFTVGFMDANVCRRTSRICLDYRVRNLA